MANEARHAIRAAHNVTNWGMFAAVRYAKNHGVSFKLLMLAFQLQRNENDSCSFLQEPTK